MSVNGLNTAEESQEELLKLKQEAYQVAHELLGIAKLKRGELLVVGCSTSEVAGASIGSYSSPQMAEAVFSGIYQATQEAGVCLVAQCFEHLNRALILEADAAEKYGRQKVFLSCDICRILLPDDS